MASTAASSSPSHIPPTSHLLLFAKVPSAGSSKTRLIPRLGPVGSSDFALAALTDVLHLFTTLSPAIQKTIFYAPASSRSAISSLVSSRQLLEEWSVQPQSESASGTAEDLGWRLSSALSQIGSSDVKSGSVTFIGMDCFTLLPAHVEDSIRLVTETGKAHMIPAVDGGYVLLTVPADCPAAVFRGIPWSCEKTGRMQRERLEESGVGCLVGAEMADVDEVEDLDRLLDEVTGGRMVTLSSTHPRTAASLEGLEN